ncbi:DNA replication licensing factor [Venturia nashicola]|uniref:DNA replication licensing factor n=1 Tax=Venturia nashicola TaxID=86259 RepID=A0A4Z1NWE2_9PEZI|nr:DNA replication licensing factor [Venturia nashicola]
MGGLIERTRGGNSSQSKEYQRAVSKGHELARLMESTMEEATEIMGNKVHIQSPYTNPEAEFEKWGWVAEASRIVEPRVLNQRGLKELLPALHLSTEIRDWDWEVLQHKKAWGTSDGRKGPAIRNLLYDS